MGSIKRILYSWAVLLFVALVTSAAVAAEPHSYCVTGDPLIPGGASDSNTNAVINSICGTSNPDPCCSTSVASSKHWDLACVQQAARFARDNLGLGDVCGRYAWTQGSIAGTGQFYPRDFNVFSLGNLSGLRDTEGPVGSAAGATFAAFNVNLKRKEPIALLAGGPGASIQQGTMWGQVVYSGSYSDPQVTYNDGSHPTKPTTPFPVDFSAAATKLVAMSQALKLMYGGIAAVKQYSGITMTGNNDPELNVFTMGADQLSGTTSYTFANVPSASTVIVNVTGTNPIMTNAGFSGFSSNQILWNFPDATNLTISGLSLPGSILAPKAVAQLRNGSVSGTVVVGSGVVNVELYSYPFRIPSTIGGRALGVDPTWSMTGNVSDEQTANALTNEAGFLQITGGPYVAENDERMSPTHRVWYEFQPAPIQPKNKPLAVFFNGGPGAATSSILFGFNTATLTMDPCKVGTDLGTSCPEGSTKAILNATPWTQFANLLFIDAPATGFSYPLANDDGTTPDLGIDIDRDAGDFDRVLLRFLRRHPEILNNRVVIVGESYGGTRATVMLDHLYNYASIVGSGPYIDLQLNNEETSYFSSVFGTPTPAATDIAKKFGHQVLIEPVVAGEYQLKQLTVGVSINGKSIQFPASNCLTPTCSSLIPGGVTQSGPSCDIYNCDKPDGWSDNLEFTVGLNLADVNTLTTVVGANVKNVEWMKASSRTKAYGRASGDGTVVPAPSMSVIFGAIGVNDNYFMLQNEWVEQGYLNGTSQAARTWNQPGSGLINATAFAADLHAGVSTFISVTKSDLVVYSPEIPFGMNKLLADNPTSTLAGLVKTVPYDPAFNTGLPRPGAMQLTYNSGDFKLITMPHVYTSGHSVTMRASGDLLADVMQWYNNSPH